LRPPSFSDHYSQARLFYRSVTPQERQHIAEALTFELGKVDIPDIRRRILGHLEIIDEQLGKTVAGELGMSGKAIPALPAIQPVDFAPSPALRLYGKYKPTLQGRKIGILLAAGFDEKIMKALVSAIEKRGASAAVIAPKIGEVKDSKRASHPADAALRSAPSVFFDAVAVLAGPEGDAELSSNPDAIGFFMDACRHRKAIGYAGVPSLVAKANGIGLDGVAEMNNSADIKTFIGLAGQGKVWTRKI